MTNITIDKKFMGQLLLMALFTFNVLSSCQGLFQNVSYTPAPPYISPEVKAALVGFEDSRLHVFVTFNRNYTVDQMEHIILSLDPGATIESKSIRLRTLAVYTTVGALNRLIEANELQSITLDRRLRIHDPIQSPFARLSDEIPGRETPATILNYTDLVDKGYNGSSIVVAILDSGIDSQHPDLDDFDDNSSSNDPKIITATSFVEGDTTPIDLTGHGTYCAGIIGGTGNASGGLYRGIAPGVSLISAKVQFAGFAYTSWIVSGINWAVDLGADIILIPFSTLGFPGDELDLAIQSAVENGVFVVTAAGDTGPDHMTILSPGGSSHAITVGAYDVYKNTVPFFSSKGPSFGLFSKPDFIAPGIDVVGPRPTSSQISGFGLDISELDIDSFAGSLGAGFDSSRLEEILGTTNFTKISDYYQVANTTAASASIFAGALALLLEYNYQISPADAMITLAQTAHPIGLGDTIEGNGIPDFGAAAQLFGENPIPRDTRITGFALPYYGAVISNSESRSATLLESVYATSTLLIVNDSSTNITNAHFLLGSFSLSYDNNSPISFSSMGIARELHYVTVPTEDYSRSVGMLYYEDVLVVPVIEVWRLPASQMPLNAFKITFSIVNMGNSTIRNVKIYSSWQIDLFLNEPDSSQDDLGAYNSSLDILYAHDSSYINGTLVSFSIGFNSSTRYSSYEVSSPDEIQDHLYENALSNQTNYYGDVALGAIWSLNDVAIGSYTNLSVVLGVGNTTENLRSAIEKTWAQTPPTIAADLVLFSPSQYRVAPLSGYYYSSVKVINVGTGPSDTDTTIAFIVNETLPGGGGIFATYYSIGSLSPYNFTCIESVWVPEHPSLYAIGWIAAPSLEQLLLSIAGGVTAITTEYYPLDNFFIKDVFIWDPPPQFAFTPKSLPYGPYELHYPGNFGVYGVSLRSNIPLSNLQITVSGNASSWVNIGNTSIPSLFITDILQVVIFVPPIIPAGLYYAVIKVSSAEGYQAQIPITLNITYPVATILFDTTHNLGLTMDTQLDESDSTGLLDAIIERSDSIYTGYHSLYQLANAHQINLVEIPQQEALNSSLLENFDGIIIADPEKPLSTNETNALSQFLSNGRKVILLLNQPPDSNLNSYNDFLTAFGVQAFGKINQSSQTYTNADSPYADYLIKNISQITVEKGVALVVFDQDIKPSIRVGDDPFLVYSPAQTYGDLIVLGSAETFSDKHISELDNARLASNIMEFLKRTQLKLTATILDGNNSKFYAGEKVYIELYITDINDAPINNLTVYCAFRLPNDEIQFFFASPVKDGKYSTVFLNMWWESTGT
ncbi:MAG: DUF4350 domain-containing protein, partial [Candidatus Ranarchaeia archaeon]